MEPADGSQTCFSTYDVGTYGSPNCYGDEIKNATEYSIVEFIENVVAAQLQYPSYQWLANASIVPSNSTGYNLTSIQNTLTKASGAVPYVCPTFPQSLRQIQSVLSDGPGRKKVSKGIIKTDRKLI